MDLYSPSRILHSNLFALPNLSRETGTGCYTLLLRTPSAEPGKSSSGQPREAGRQSQAQAHRGRAAGRPGRAEPSVSLPTTQYFFWFPPVRIVLPPIEIQPRRPLSLHPSTSGSFPTISPVFPVTTPSLLPPSHPMKLLPAFSTSIPSPFPRLVSLVTKVKLSLQVPYSLGED